VSVINADGAITAAFEKRGRGGTRAPTEERIDRDAIEN
jgi:hypothetical protein